MRALVIDASVHQVTQREPSFKEGDTVNLLPSPDNDPEYCVVESDNPCLGWKIKRFAPISDIEDYTLSEEECEAIRHRQLTPLKALVQHSLPKGYKLPLIIRK